MQSAAQQSQEDVAVAAQVRQEMWGNLQSILAMVVGQGCSRHVQDMVHQIAVHFANEQSQSVALERRMTCNLSREKEAQQQLQQQLRGGIQVTSFFCSCYTGRCSPAESFGTIAAVHPRHVIKFNCICSPPPVIVCCCTQHVEGFLTLLVLVLSVCQPYKSDHVQCQQ